MPALLLFAIGIHAGFEAGSVGKVERLSETHFRCAVIGEVDQQGRNRQPSWFYFRLDGVAGREVTIDLADLHGEYNYKPYTGELFRTMRPVWSEDDRTWTHVPAEWIAGESVLRIRVKTAGDRLWIARQPPYSTARLQALLAEFRGHPWLRQETAGRTVEGRPIVLLTVGQPAAAKPVLWLMARQHAWESGTSWAAEGALRFLLSADPRAERIRRECVFKILPMADPDGVARGGVRFNRHGYDLNRNWDTADPQLTPEICAAQRAILAGRADLFITLHNTETADYIEGPVRFRDLAEALNRRLEQTTTFYASKGPRDMPASAGKGRFTANQWLFTERGIPAFLIELMVDPNPKIHRAPTVADRLEFGARLVEAMAAQRSK